MSDVNVTAGTTTPVIDTETREGRQAIVRASKEGVLYERSTRAPGASKDEYSFILNQKGVILNKWAINPRVALHRPQQGNSAVQSVATLQDFMEGAFNSEIEHVFGKDVLHTARVIAEGAIA